MEKIPAILLAAGCAVAAHAQFLQDLMPHDKAPAQPVGEIKIEARRPCRSDDRRAFCPPEADESAPRPLPPPGF